MCIRDTLNKWGNQGAGVSKITGFRDLFRVSLADIGRGDVAPAIINESKPVGSGLNEDVNQLQKNVEADPPMEEGVAVLTNGWEWRLYRVEERGNLAVKLIQTVNIMNCNQRKAAQTLNDWLNRSQWR